MKKILCKLFGHKFLHNFRSIPNKMICVRCREKYRLNLRELEWEKVDGFDTQLGTDEELIKRWMGNN